MGLRVVPEKKKLQVGGPEAGGPRAATTRTTADGYFDRIVKYIPSQVITFYTAAIVWMTNPSAPTTGQPPAAGAATVPSASATGPELWLVFVAGLGLTLFLTYWQTREADKPPAVIQISISSLAFIVWAYATGGPFVGTGFWKPGWAAIVLALFVIIIGTISPGERETGAPGGE